MNIAILLAAGKSRRFGREKLFEHIRGEPVFIHSLRMLEQSSHVDAIFIVANSANKRKIEVLLKKDTHAKVRGVLMGGATRFLSVKKAVGKIHVMMRLSKGDNLIIHNAANPLATSEEVARCLKALKSTVSGVSVGREVRSTLKKVSSQNQHAKTLPRHGVWEVETPQVSRAADFLKALRHAKGVFTDDLSVLEAAGFKTALVRASYKNRKISTREDLELMRFFAGELPKNFTVGVGEDSHSFSEQGSVNGEQKLGGLLIKEVPHLEAESDGDVILHALCNAIASAIGEGSLGTYATEMAGRGKKDSRIYLRYILKQAQAQGYYPHHCTLSVTTASPKIDPLVPLLKKSLGGLLKISTRHIGITATSGNGLGKGGIKCTAVVMLNSIQHLAQILKQVQDDI